MDVEQFRLYVVQPVLKYMGMGGPNAEELLIGTAVQESGGLKYIKQLGSGPALGVYQIEPATHNDVLKNYAAYRPEIMAMLNNLRFDAFQGQELELISNMAYSTAIARLIYRRQREPLPDHEDIMGMAKYYKKYYNTFKGKATVGDYVRNYYRYVKEEEYKGEVG